ncbi:unnamed protein product [Vitrella brassicaformis CCMP3155]|uniref:Uncharacterized protein n=1 Tax=Vitrella brassicaformis (strain CCMP3155) TaxID=1169540 RepID=A0A0G4ELA7_VITBC|nr:unnamed protein product [Vitrella brassicaformis CCMP3155]|eukprot:CEL98197.1 unnamed protein product [Vitrella brassicaformis CCMP3155]
MGPSALRAFRPANAPPDLLYDGGGQLRVDLSPDGEVETGRIEHGRGCSIVTSDVQRADAFPREWYDEHGMLSLDRINNYRWPEEAPLVGHYGILGDGNFSSGQPSQYTYHYPYEPVPPVAPATAPALVPFVPQQQDFGRLIMTDPAPAMVHTRSRMHRPRTATADVLGLPSHHPMAAAGNIPPAVPAAAAATAAAAAGPPPTYPYSPPPAMPYQPAPADPAPPPPPPGSSRGSILLSLRQQRTGQR